MLWQYKLRDKESDFYTAEDIQSMFRDDVLKKDTMVRPQNSPNWVPLGTVPLLQPPKEGTGKSRFALENVAKRSEENAKMLDLPDSMTKYISADIMKKRLDKEDEDRPRPVSNTNLPRLTEEERQILNENRSATIKVKNTSMPRAVEPSPSSTPPVRPGPFPVRSPQPSAAASPAPSPAPTPAAPNAASASETRPAIQVQSQSQVSAPASAAPAATRQERMGKLLAIVGGGMCVLAIIGVVLVLGGAVDFGSFGFGLLFGLGFYPLARFYVFNR